MSRNKVARTYAEALFYAAQKLGQENDLGTKLRALKNRLEEDVRWRQIFLHEGSSPEEREKALQVLLPKLFHRTEEAALIETIEEYQALLDTAKNMELVEITSAVPLSPALRADLEKKLGGIVEGKVRLNITIDPQILGGLVIHWGDRVIDASVRKKLESIGARLKGS